MLQKPPKYRISSSNFNPTAFLGVLTLISGQVGHAMHACTSPSTSADCDTWHQPAHSVSATPARFPSCSMGSNTDFHPLLVPISSILSRGISNSRTLPPFSFRQLLACWWRLHAVTGAGQSMKDASFLHEVRNLWASDGCLDQERYEACYSRRRAQLSCA